MLFYQQRNSKLLFRVKPSLYSCPRGTLHEQVLGRDMGDKIKCISYLRLGNKEVQPRETFVYLPLTLSHCLNQLRALHTVNLIYSDFHKPIHSFTPIPGRAAAPMGKQAIAERSVSESLPKVRKERYR
jgi:hypothetical protein